MRAAGVALLAAAATAASASTGNRPSPPPRAAGGQKMPLPPGFEQFAQQMFKGVVRANKDVLVQPTFRDAVLGFYHAVDWTEPWIMCLLNLHVAVWIVAVATRTRPNFQIGLFLAICAAVYAAQFLNAYGARHWRALGLTQNYFDDRGVFISFLYSLPLLSAAGFQMLYAFFTSSSLLIKVKRAELRTQRRSQQQPAAAGGGTEAPLAAPAGDAKKDR